MIEIQAKAVFTVTNPEQQPFKLTLDHRESSDRYRGVIFRQGCARVILCKDGIQWIFQRRKGVHGCPWRGIGYFTTRAALIKAWAALRGEMPPELTALPDRARESVNG